jgi:uncharacterized protein
VLCPGVLKRSKKILESYKPGDELIPCLMQAGCDQGVIDHCITVRDVALKVASRVAETGVQVDLDLVAKGAIIHDIGRSVTHGMDHADEGGVICKNLGMSDKIRLIVERHIGAGLTSDERIRLGLPSGDRIPKTIEEKIVAHADNLVKGSRVMNKNEYLNSLNKLPEDIRKRFLDLALELNSFELID